jgi:2-polyprenyl-3-methyl-5-hydroxy-6-metoxy-1,4-benzoquinol methylase
MSKDFWYKEDNELKVLEILRNAKDVSSGSDELKLHISDWQTEYQLSPARNILLLPFIELFKGKHVLEIGAGMGAITRQLGEIAETVTALEPSQVRIDGNKERCRDLKNVEFVAEGLSLYNSAKKFDVVVVVGVLEYAGKIFLPDSKTLPEEQFLNKCKSLLKEDGILIVAIENKLSLKYFSGNREDHTRKFSESIHNFPNKSGIKTFSQVELQNLLKSTGFKDQEFFSVYPDYKLPHTIASPLINKIDTDISHFLFQNYSQEFHESKFNFIDEYVLMSELLKEGVLDHFANSFLVISSPNKLDLKTDWVLQRHAFSRKKEFRNKIILYPNGEIEKGNDTTQDSKVQLIKNVEPLILRFIRLAQADSFAEDWKNLFRQFFAFLQTFKYDELDPKFFEFHLNNIFIKDNGEFHWFDKESPVEKLQFKYSINHILIRNALSLLSTCSKYLYKIYPEITIYDAVKFFIKDSLNIDLTDEEIHKYIEVESLYLNSLNQSDFFDWKEKINASLGWKIVNTHELLKLLDLLKTPEIINYSLGYGKKEEQVKNLTDLLSEKQNEIAKLLNLLDEKGKEYEEMKAVIEKQSNEMKEINDLKEKAGHKENHVKEQENLISKINKEVEKLKKGLEESSSEIKKLEETNKSLAGAKEDLEKKLIESEKTLISIYNSKSYKMSAKLGKLSRSLKLR